MKAFLRLGLWASAWLVVSLAIFLLARPSLPDPIAIHWGPGGLPDGSAPAWALPLVAVGVVAIGLILTLFFRAGRQPTMEAYALAGMSGGLAVGIVLVSVLANRGLADWTDAAEIGLGSIIVLFALPAAGMGIGIALGRIWHPTKAVPRSVDGEEVIEVEPGEHVNWVGRARVKGVPLVLFAVAVILLLALPDLPLWAFVLVLGLGIVFSQVEAQVTDDGVRVRLGGLPVKRVDLDTISSARSVDANPLEWGGWGWRAAPGKTAIVLRRGEAIVMTLTSGRQFLITVDDAPVGAALINGLIERAIQGS